MRNLPYLFLLISLFSFSQGLIPASIEDYNNVPSVRFDNQFGFTESIPEFYSLENYVPPVLMQEGNSCTGFSIFYYGLSTQYNRELNITNSIDKTGHSFDPYFGYTIVNDKNSNSGKQCDATNRMIEVLDVLKLKGAKKLFFSPHIECNSSSNLLNDDKTEEYISPYSIDGYNRVPALGSNLGVEYTKMLITNNKPVLVAAFFPNNIKNIESDGNYSPKDWELNNVKNVFSKGNSLTLEERNVFLENNFAHAVTIIGYDDNIYGGAFRVVNSWGDEWGDEGYFWLKYKDFKILTFETYILNLSLDIKPKENLQFSIDNYKRINYGDEVYYEGSMFDEMRNGQGIFSFDSEEGRINVIGNWKDDKMNGFFTIINTDNEIYFGIYENGEYVENNSFGFSLDDDPDDEKERKKQEKFKEYWKKIGGDKKIRRSKTVILKPKNKT
jgi:hypothetical protein